MKTGGKTGIFGQKNNFAQKNLMVEASRRSFSSIESHPESSSLLDQLDPSIQQELLRFSNVSPEEDAWKYLKEHANQPRSFDRKNYI